MSVEAPIPEGVWPKVRWTLTYLSPWIIFLVAIERFVDGHFASGFVLSVLFILNLVIVSKWEAFVNALGRARRRIGLALSPPPQSGLTLVATGTVGPVPGSPQYIADAQAKHDLLHLSDFAVYQATFVMLSHLVDSIPAGIHNIHTGQPEFTSASANDETHKQARNFIDYVCRYIMDGSHRAQSFHSVLLNAESHADYELKQTAPDQRPQGVDPLVLRDYAISYRQAVATAFFLRSEKKEVEQIVINKRQKLIQILESRNK
jgi:hypothetical protein